jgi:pimeloyl-ACP methyl ester carboxylesterase
MGRRANSSDPSRRAVVSLIDGTSIGYYTVGSGTGVVLVHGAGQSSKNLRALADYLAADFAVHVPDRRGRGMTPSYGDFRGLCTEIEDLSALLQATGSSSIFGLSAGAVIALETAVVRPEITKLALYEPPLSFDNVVHGAWVPRYEKMLAAGKPGRAFVAILKDTADRTSIVRHVPSSLLGPPLDFIIRRTANRAPPPGGLSAGELIPTLHYDAQTVLAAKGPLERFKGLRCQVLLLGGEKSARSMTASLDGLSNVLPEATRMELAGVGHSAADNSRQPALVARELQRFFAG